MTIFTTASIDIHNAQPDLTPDALDDLRSELEEAMERAAQEVLRKLGIDPSADEPIVIVNDLYQAGGEDPAP